MSKTIALPDAVYAQLEHHARARGSTLPHLIATLVQEVEKAHMAVVLERMRTKGFLLVAPWPAQPTPTDFAPISVQGKPLSEVIIEERR